MATYTTRSYLGATRQSAKVKALTKGYLSTFSRGYIKALIKGYSSVLFKKNSFILSPIKSKSFKASNRQISQVTALSLSVLREKFGSGNAIDHKEFSSNFIGSAFNFSIKTSSDYSLAEAFGADAWQDENWLVIDKGNLLLIGELSIDQFLVVLILRWSSLFQPDRRISCQYWRSIPVFFQSRWWEKYAFLIHLLAINSPNFPSPSNFLV